MSESIDTGADGNAAAGSSKLLTVRPKSAIADGIMLFELVDPDGAELPLSRSVSTLR